MNLNPIHGHLLTFAILASLPLSPTIARADIVGGDEVIQNDPVRKSTIGLYSPSSDGQGGALCTASLISSDTAVTAAHCISGDGTKPVIIFGSDIHSPESAKRSATAVEVNPRWKTHQGKGMDQGDIALVKFSGGIPGGYEPALIAKSDLPLEKGDVATLAGFGISNAAQKTGAGTLRKTTVQIDRPRPGKSEMILDQSHGKGACHGDSGGPAFIDSHGKPILVGVTNRSYPASAPDDCAHRVVYTKVSAYQPWIQKTEQKFHSRPDGGLQAYRATAAPRALRSIHEKISRRLQVRPSSPSSQKDLTASESPRKRFAKARLRARTRRKPFIRNAADHRPPSRRHLARRKKAAKQGIKRDVRIFQGN